MTRVYTHPVNVAVLQHALDNSVRDCDLEILASEFLPIRRIERVWFPPADDRFVTYEEKDHGWLKKLGFGEYRDVDMGPYFLAFNPHHPLMDRDFVMDDFRKTNNRFKAIVSVA